MTDHITDGSSQQSYLHLIKQIV